jgi:glucokinase
MYTIGIDLGGTSIKGGVCDEHGTLLAQDTIATEAQRGVEHVLARLAALINDLPARAALDSSEIAAVGVGAPGPLSQETGVVHNAPNLPGWVNIPLRQRLAAATGRPVVIENDANAAAFGEFIAGAGRNVSSLVMLTLGTGIGGGIVLDGRVWRGCDGAGAEIGHLVLVPGGRPCPCGQQGCFERYASANAVAERLVEAIQAGAPCRLKADVDAGHALDARDVLQATANDALARRIWDETCHYLALGCVSLERIISPERIVLAGGLINAGEQLLAPVRSEFQRLRWHLTPVCVEIVLATLGTDAGTIGAAALARAAVTGPSHPQERPPQV